MAEQGWVKIHRKIKTGWIWSSPEPYDFRSAWIDLILSANHEENNVYIDGQLVKVERGSFITSQAKLAQRWKWDRKKVKRFLDLLEQDGMVSVISTTRRTAITIENYSKYQDYGASVATSPTPSYGQVLPQVFPTNKNEKNIKNEKNDKEYIRSFDTFWEVYPRKVAKANARKAWDKLKPDDELLDKILIALEKQKKSKAWTRDGGQYIPHPATWLNGHRWEDEIEEGNNIGNDKTDSNSDSRKRWNLPE